MNFWSRTSSKTFNRYSEFHASREAIIRQLPKGNNTWCFIVILKKTVAIHNRLGCIAYYELLPFFNNTSLFRRPPKR